MNEFLSFFGVIALWIGVSYAAWWIHQRATGSGYKRREELAAEAEKKVAEAPGIFKDIRSDGTAGDLTQATHALLRRIQAHGPFFDDVNALRPRIAGAVGEECEPLAEILHIRRDLWAASEIVLIEDFRSLGSDFDQGEYQTLRAEAVSLLFRDAAVRSGDEDLIDLRLSMARDEARKFAADVEESNRQAREHERLPTFSEVIAYPVAAARAVPGQIRSLRAQFASFRAQVGTVATAIQNSETMARGLSGLARAREELPQRIVTGLEKASNTLEKAGVTARERASTTARQSAANAKGHYDFLVAAYDFQARYEAALRKAPELTERGKQFIARLELAEKSERLKLTSATVRDAMKRGVVRGLAHAIALLQRAQLALEAQLAQQRIGKDSPVRAERHAGKAKAKNAVRMPAEAIPLRPSVPIGSRRALGAGPAAAGRSGRPLPGLALNEPEESPVPVKRGPVIPKGIKPAAFDSVLAWYKPAVTILAEKKGIVDTAVVVATPAAPPESMTATPEPAAGRPAKKPGFLRRLFGGGKRDLAPMQPKPPAVKARTIAMPAKTAKKTGNPVAVQTKPSTSAKPAPANAAAKAETASKPASATPAPTLIAGRDRRGWFGRRRADKAPPPDTASSSQAKGRDKTAKKVAQAKPAAPVKAEIPAPKPAETKPAPPPASAGLAAPTAEKSTKRKWFGRRRAVESPAGIARRENADLSSTDNGPAENAVSAPGVAAPPALTPTEIPPHAAAAEPDLTAKLTGADDAITSSAEENGAAEEPELILTDGEDDDPGELTRSILESRARQAEKPDRSQNRAFPWLRR